MTTLDRDQLAAEARRLKENEALQLALDTLRTNALEQLASVTATDTESIRVLQCTVKVVEQIRDDIEGLILAAAPRKSPGIV